jgi:hypothetical protein
MGCRRYSKKDRELLQQVKTSAAGIVEAAVELGADEEDVQEVIDEAQEQAAGKALDALVAFGGAVKALGEGKVGGYLVRFSDPANPADRDLMGEYFTKSTYFGARAGDGADALFHHGMPVAEGLEALADRLLPPIKTVVDEVGVWAEIVLNMADEYERMIYDMVQAGKLGWSSGAPSHMVRRVGSQITRWPIAEGSLTPMPAEPRNKVVSLKTLTPALSVKDGRYLEKLGPIYFVDKADACRLDSYVHRKLSPAVAVISNLEHLEGQTVTAWGDGADLGSFVVVSGAITLPVAVSTIVVGLPYDARYKSTKLSFGAKDGTALT